MTQRKWRLAVSALVVIGLASLGGMKLTAAGPDRADCPGKITCPLTGDLVCRDHCPTIDPDRPDCPGRIVCPLTGKLVCKDRCPLGAKTASGDAKGRPVASCCEAKTEEKPSCCAAKD